MALFHECDDECQEYKDKDHPIKKRWQIGEYYFRRCPKSQINQEVYWWIKSYNLYKNGILPTNEGWLYQSSKFIDVMCFIESEITKHNKEQNGRK